MVKNILYIVLFGSTKSVSIIGIRTMSQGEGEVVSSRQNVCMSGKAGPLQIPLHTSCSEHSVITSKVSLYIHNLAL